MTDDEEDEGEEDEGGEASPPLFRPEAQAQPEIGDVFAFNVPAWRTIVIFAAAALLLIAAFAALTDFNRVVSVPGRILPRAGIARLAAPQAGIVTAVYKRQGSVVQRGEPILRIASAALLSNGVSPAARQLEGYRAEQLLLRESAAAEKLRLEERRTQLVEERERLAGTVESLGRQVSLQGERILQKQQQLIALRPLREKGYVSKFRVQAEQDALFQFEQQHSLLMEQRNAAAHQLTQASSRLSELAAEARQTTARSASAQSALERGAAGAEAVAELIVAAPYRGKLEALYPVTGAMVGAREEVAAVVPENGTELMIELFVPPEAAGSLAADQSVTLRYDAFPFQRFGVGRGRILSVAGIASRIGSGGTSAYRVTVGILPGSSGPPVSKLRPDMTLSGNIILERRSLLDWILAPLRQRARSSLSGDTW